MDALWSELNEYERDTLVLRLDKQEVSDLIAILVDCPLDHPYKAGAVALAEKLGSE